MAAQRWHTTGIRYALWLCMLASILTMTSTYANAQEVGEASGITVTRRVVFDESLASVKAIPLLTLYADPDTTTPAISVAWAVDESGWFPIWNLHIRIHAGPSGQASRTERVITLGPKQPALGHGYEVAVSYAYDTQTLAFSISDLTEGYLLEQGDWRLETGEFVDRLYSAEGDSDMPLYTPIGIRWDTVERVNGNPIPVQHIFAGDAVGVRLSTNSPLSGTLRLAVRGGDEEVILPLAAGADMGFIPLDTSILPPGLVSIALQYVLDESVVWESAERRVVVGRVIGQIEQATFNEHDNTLDLTIALNSDRPMDPMNLRLAASVAARTWDDVRNTFIETPYSVQEVELTDLQSTQGRAVVRIRVPEEAGLWQVALAIDAQPEVVTRLEPAALTVSTTTGALLGWRGSEQETVRVCTYNMLNFEGWPQDAARKDLGDASDPRRLNHFTQVVRSLACDILGIQEGYSVDMMRTIGHRLGLNVVPFPSSTRFPGGTLTKFPVLESRMFNHAGAANQNLPFSRFGGASLIDIDGDLVWVVNFHAWPHDEEMRRREAEILGHQLDQLMAITPYLIVLGDFNSRIGEAIDLTLRKRGLVNAMYLDWIVGLRPSIDHIYVSRDMAGWVATGWVESGPGFADPGQVGGRGWVNSDHRPTIIELVWPRRNARN